MTEMTPERLRAFGDEMLANGEFYADDAATVDEFASAWEADRRDARRYRWLRGDGSTPTAYAPEEANVWGGDELDAFCDAALAAQGKPTTDRQ